MPAQRYIITVSAKNSEVFRGEYEFDHDNQTARHSALADAVTRSGYGGKHDLEDEITTNIIALPG